MEHQPRTRLRIHGTAAWRGTILRIEAGEREKRGEGEVTTCEPQGEVSPVEKILNTNLQRSSAVFPCFWFLGEEGAGRGRERRCSHTAVTLLPSNLSIDYPPIFCCRSLQKAEFRPDPVFFTSV